MIVTQCSRDPNTYCCGDGFDSTVCCEQGNGFRIINGKAVSVKNSTAITSSSPISTVTATVTKTPRNSTTKTGSIAGGVIGGIIAVAFLVGMLWYLMRKRKGVLDKEEVHTLEMSSKDQYQVNGGPSALSRIELEPTMARTPELDAGHTVELGEGKSKPPGPQL